MDALRTIVKRGWRLGAGLLWFGAVLFGEPVRFEPVADEARRVVIVANSTDADSVELARFYAEKRGIPLQNIVALPLPAGEETDWNDFVALLFNPLQQWLMDEGWIEAIVMDATDEVGRRKLSLTGHRISYLVTCRGVPLKIRQTVGVSADANSAPSKAFTTHQAAVDSELALIVGTETKLDGFVPNPIFKGKKKNIWEPDMMVRVSRLDGPTFPAIKRMIDSAIVVEKRGLIGRALVDVGGPHKHGDVWFRSAAKALEAAGWSPSVDEDRATIKSSARVDSVAWYLGWYAGDINGPFKLPGFEFAPGAIALHLHSFSARTLRLENKGGWSAPLIARGATATFGNVYEPYLEYTHQPQLLTQAFLGGATLGEAAYYAMPVLSWQAIVLGDPLYRPISRSVAEQWERRAELPNRQASYLAIRRIKNAIAQPDADLAEILIEASRLLREFPSLALALELGRLRDLDGDRAGGVRELGVAAYLNRISAQDWGLMAEVAEQLAKWEEPANAVKVWETLFKQDLPPELRISWLNAAVPVGKAAQQFSKTVEWEREIARLSQQ